MAQILLSTGSDESRSLPLNAMRLVNMFVEKQGQDAKSQAPIFGRPGLDIAGICGTGPIRGMWTMNDILYVVSGTNLFTVISGVTVIVGTGINGSNFVGMSDNGTQLCIVNGVNGWIYTVAGGLVIITDAAFEPADVVIYFDGYFVFNRSGTNQFFLSALLDGTSYNALDFASAESSPEEITTLVQNLQLLFIFKPDEIELWYDAGTADFPFARYAGGVINYGCASPFSVTKQDGAIFFLGSDGVFYRLQGNVPIRVSTNSMEHIIAGEPSISDISSFTWTWEGHKFIALTMPVQARTIVYDISQAQQPGGGWAERWSWDSNGNSLGQWTCGFSIDGHFGVTYFGDYFNGSIWVENWDTFTENGNTIEAVIDSVTIHSDKKRVFIARVELDIQAGVGTTTGQGSDPVVQMQWSKDGGMTWSSLQPWRSMGKIGAYTQRLRWMSQMGSAYQWILRFVISDPVRRVIIAAHADIAIGV